MNSREAIFTRHIRPLAPVPTGISPVLAKIKPVSAILFDVYGTLLISSAGEISVDRESASGGGDINRLLQHYGIEHTPDSLVHALKHAIARAHADLRQQGIDCPEVDIVRIWQRVLGTREPPMIGEFALEYELTVNPVYPMPGMRALLSACKAGQIVMGLISNAQFYTIPVLEQFLGASLMDWGFNRRLLFFSWLEQYAKPSPVMFERAKAVLGEMNIPAASVIYVGNDMRNDMMPAASVGFKTALFAGDRRSLRQRKTDACCLALTPNLIVTDLRQLIVCIGNG